MKKRNLLNGLLIISLCFSTGCGLQDAGETVSETIVKNIAASETEEGTEPAQEETEKSADTADEENKEESGQSSETIELTDMIRWFNASYAILTELNRCDYNIYGGLEVNGSTASLIQSILSRDWDVTDRASADETLEWAYQEGHRTSFMQDAQEFEKEGLGEVPEAEREDWLKEHYIIEDSDLQRYLDGFSIYETYGAHAIDAWDYSRALNLCSFYYVAGYYTKEEALDKSLEIAQTVQESFSSWDAYIDSYLLGYTYWSGESRMSEKSFIRSC